MFAFACFCDATFVNLCPSPLEKCPHGEAIAQFLPCDDCKKHFLDAFDGCWYRRCELFSAPDESSRSRLMVLWVWRLHNAVSLNVLHEHPPKDKRKVVDRRWPPYRDCPGCWRPDVVMGVPPESMQLRIDSGEIPARMLDAAFDLELIRYPRQVPKAPQGCIGKYSQNVLGIL